MDRIDIHVEVSCVPIEKFSEKRTGEASEKVGGRVKQARSIQRERFKGANRLYRK